VKPLMAAAAVEATDQQLVAAARDGSDTAFEALFRRYRDRIAAYVRGIVSDHGRAEDIVQDVFISAHRNLLASDREITFKPWVYEIAKNACIDHIRRARRASEVSIDSDDFSDRDEGRVSAAIGGTDAEVSIRQELDSLKMAFNELPDQQHEILVMRELEGLSYDKIAVRTGLSRSAVESVLFRARRRLKDEFDDISTGERCLSTQTALGKFADGGIGLREERRMSGHLRDCAACRREAVAMGLDDLALGLATGRVRSALSRAAALLPLPTFLRRRWIDSLQSLGSGAGGAEQGFSLATKAVAVLAAAALVGGGAQVARVTAGHGSAAPGSGKSSESRDKSGSVGSSAAGGQGGGGRARSSKGGPGRSSGGGGGPSSGTVSGANGSAGGESGSGAVKGTLGETLSHGTGTAGSLGGGLGGSAQGTVGGNTGSTVGQVTKGVGDTVQQVGSGAGKTVDQVTSGAGKTVDQVGGTAGGTVNKLPSSTVPDVQNTLKQTTSSLQQTPVSVPGVKLPSTTLTP
jgi:RNA polymerase sigma factor (sigma-70 family)